VEQRLDATHRILIQAHEFAFSHSFHRRGVGGDEKGSHRQRVASIHLATDTGSVVATVATRMASQIPEAILDFDHPRPFVA
jgi:hypothetical protein